MSLPCEAGALFAVTLLSESHQEGPSLWKIIMYDPVEEGGHLVAHVMASLSAYKSADVSPCHLSFLLTPEDNNVWAKGGRGERRYALYGLSVALSATLLSALMKCVLISSGVI